MNIVEKYIAAFNAGETEKMLSCLHPEVEHEINQGKSEFGIEAFRRFMSHMDTCYKEKLQSVVVFSSNNQGGNDSLNRVSAEYEVHGVYLKTDGSLPPAHGQKYVIRAGSFFEIRDGLISRVTTYYNLPKWIEMVKN